MGPPPYPVPLAMRQRKLCRPQIALQGLISSYSPQLVKNALPRSHRSRPAHLLLTVPQVRRRSESSHHSRGGSPGHSPCSSGPTRWSSGPAPTTTSTQPPPARSAKDARKAGPTSSARSARTRPIRRLCERSSSTSPTPSTATWSLTPPADRAGRTPRERLTAAGRPAHTLTTGSSAKSTPRKRTSGSPIPFFLDGRGRPTRHQDTHPERAVLGPLTQRGFDGRCSYG